VPNTAKDYLMHCEKSEFQGFVQNEQQTAKPANDKKKILWASFPHSPSSSKIN